MRKEGIKRYKLKISIFLLLNIIFSKYPPEFILLIYVFYFKKVEWKNKKSRNNKNDRIKYSCSKQNETF